MAVWGTRLPIQIKPIILQRGTVKNGLVARRESPADVLAVYTFEKRAFSTASTLELSGGGAVRLDDWLGLRDMLNPNGRTRMMLFDGADCVN